MMQKFLVLALSGILIIQTCHVYGQDSKIVITSPAETVSEKEFENAIATRTINTLLRHFRITLTNSVSAPVVRYIATSVRFVLTNETGQETVKHLIDFLADTLMDENTLVGLQVIHKRLVQLAASGRNTPMVLATAAAATLKIVDEPQLLAAIEGLIEGINLLMEDMTEQKLREGILRVMKLQKLASFLKPNKVLDKGLTTLQKLRRTNSDIPVSYQNAEVDRELQLQTRGVGHGDEYGWINRQDKTKNSKGKKGSDNESLDLE